MKKTISCTDIFKGQTKILRTVLFGMDGNYWKHRIFHELMMYDKL